VGKRNNQKVTAKQLANLQPAKKGQVRNPLGGGSHNPLLKALRNITTKQFTEMVELALTSNVAELERIYKDPATPAFKAATCGAMADCVKHKNWDLLNKIAERVIGKVPDKLEFSGNVQNSTDMSQYSAEQLLAIREILAKKAQP